MIPNNIPQMTLQQQQQQAQQIQIELQQKSNAAYNNNARFNNGLCFFINIII
jgi:hypothetical protein